MNRRLNSPPIRKQAALSRVDSQVGYWLRCVAKHYSHTLGRRLERKGVTLAELMLMRELYDGDRRPSDLAERLGLTRGAISKIVRQLADGLMITQEECTADGRGQVLSLTDNGRAVVRVFAGILDDTDEEFFGDLTPETRALILTTLREIVHRRGLRPVPMPVD